MLLYLDTNAYIASKYRFSDGNLAKLKELILQGEIVLLYSSATKGEVEEHIRRDVKAAVSGYNRTVRKDMLSLTALEKYSMPEISEEEAIDAVLSEFNNLLGLEGVQCISLNPLDAEELMADYFGQKPPFETKKPYEFKDAIVIKAIKTYQKSKDEKIYVVSDDEGFRKAFDDDEEIVAVQYLTNAFSLHYHNKEYVEFAENAIDEGELNSFLLDYFGDFDVDRGYYGEWELNDKDIVELETYLLFAELIENGCIMHLLVEIYVEADITHRDEDTSFYDREEGRYLIEEYVRWNEHHRVTIEISVECGLIKDEDGHLCFDGISVVKEPKHRVLDLDEETLTGWDEIDSDYREEPDILYCSECGKVLGYRADYFDYRGNPLCDKCMQTNSKGDVCPGCGLKYPSELMINGFCENCAEEHD